MKNRKQKSMKKSVVILAGKGYCSTKDRLERRVGTGRVFHFRILHPTLFTCCLQKGCNAKCQDFPLSHIHKML